jgi:hypothetical protein
MEDLRTGDRQCALQHAGMFGILRHERAPSRKPQGGPRAVEDDDTSPTIAEP